MKTTHAALIAALFPAFLISCSSTASLEQDADNFAIADANGDGKLSRKEASDAVVLSVHYAYDTNKDGKLTFAEWRENDSTADAKLFKRRDANRDGVISLREAEASADRQRVFGDFFKEADKDGDGLLSRDEAAACSARAGS